MMTRESNPIAQYQLDKIRKDEFTMAYVEALFFTDGHSDGELAEKGIEDLDWSLAAEIIRDCAIFQAAHEREIDSAYSSAGHDFWLTRSGHGAGFWDGNWPKEEGERMTATSKAFGDVSLYVGDDGLIYS